MVIEHHPHQRIGHVSKLNAFKGNTLQVIRPVSQSIIRIINLGSAFVIHLPILNQLNRTVQLGTN